MMARVLTLLLCMTGLLFPAFAEEEKAVGQAVDAQTAGARSAAIRLLPVQEDGWNGADAAYSRLLEDGRRLWLFGDTLVGKVEGGKRLAPEMFRNSVAIEYADGRMQYFWGNDGEDGVFVSPREDEWYWPADFVVLGKTGYFFMRRIVQENPDDVMGFKVAGTDIAIVENLYEEPQQWKIAVHSHAGNGVAVGVAAAVQGDYVYMLVNDGQLPHRFYLARMAVLAMESRLLVPTYYHPRRKQWRGSEPHVALLEDGAPEASLEYDANRREWRLIYSKSGLSADIVMQSAAEITGPWSEPEIVASCPEADGKNIICYAGKEVYGAFPPEVTYSVNSLQPADLEVDATLYIPRRVYVDVR